MKVPFYSATVTGDEQRYVAAVLGDGGSFGEKGFVARCEAWVRDRFGLSHFALTKSCTQSLELAALLLDIQAGDEVIMPSFAFVSCGNAFALRGATCVYVDVYADSMNIDDTKIEAAITPRTKAIVTINYLGVACHYDAIMAIAEKHKIYVVEDNAHGTGATYQGKYLGSFGHISTFSFDHLKSISCGQGGGIAVHDPALLEQFYIHYEFGTNRRSFLRGEMDRYEWKGLGSNYPLSELNAGMLYAQLENMDKINGAFLQMWHRYMEGLNDLAQRGLIGVYEPGEKYGHQGYCFYIKVKDKEERAAMIEFLNKKGVSAQFHYTPLHTSSYGLDSGRLSGTGDNTVRESQRLLRLPLFYGITVDQVAYVVAGVREFYD